MWFGEFNFLEPFWFGKVGWNFVARQARFLLTLENTERSETFPLIYKYIIIHRHFFFTFTTTPRSHVQGAEYLYSYCCCAFFKCSFNSSSLSANPSAFSLTLFKYISLVIEGSLGIAIPFCTAGRALIRSHHLYKLGNFSRLTPAK